MMHVAFGGGEGSVTRYPTGFVTMEFDTMIRTMLTLTPTEGRAPAVVQLYRSEQILQESLDLTRALASEISVAADGSGEILVTAVWPDADAYQEWIDHPNRGRTAPELQELLEGAKIGIGRVFEIDHRVAKHSTY